MKFFLFFRKLRENARAVTVNLACVFLIILITGACAGTKKMQTTSGVNETLLASAEKGSKINAISDDQKMVCRHMKFTGSIFKKKVCKTQAQWDWENENKHEHAEKLQKDADESRSQYVPIDPLSGTFPGAGVPR